MKSQAKRFSSLAQIRERLPPPNALLEVQLPSRIIKHRHPIEFGIFTVVMIIVVIVQAHQAVPYNRNDYDGDNDNRVASA
jgi:hypothetical protein